MRLDDAAEQLDVHRRLAEIERRLDDLAALLERGDIAAAPAVRAVLQGRRLTVTPVIVRGERRWSLSAWISSGYLFGLDRAENGGGNDATASPKPPRIPT